MPNDSIDFLDIESQEFPDIGRFGDHIRQNVDISELDGNLSVIGSLSNFEDKEEFKQSLKSYFKIIEDLGDLYLLQSLEREVNVYLHKNRGCPIFLTTGTKTKDIPRTIGEYIKHNPEISRLWVGKQQMEEIRRELTADEDLLIPYFTANYSPSSNVENVVRPGRSRTVQYHGNDGLESFKEMRDKYGVYPTNIQFLKPGDFKFRITQEGVFTINQGGLEPTFTLIRDVIDHLRDVKSAIRSAWYDDIQSEFGTHPKSIPWKIKLDKPLKREDLVYLKEDLLSDGWEFGLSRMEISDDDPVGFNGEVVDKINYGTLGIRTKNEKTIRAFPREITGFGQSIRFFNFVENNLDQNAVASEA